jgi:hypothetical protein
MERNNRLKVWKRNGLNPDDYSAAVGMAMEEYAKDSINHVDGNPLPNEIDLILLKRLLKYSNRYEISIQFWPDMTAVFIQKDGVQLFDIGNDFKVAITDSINYLDRISQS